MTDEFETWLERLQNVKRSADGNSAEASCPLPGHEHGDRNPSLSIRRGDRVPVVVTCHKDASHTYEAMRDLLGVGDSAGAMDVYLYTDEIWMPLYEVGRFRGKKFLQRRPGRTDWKGGIGGVRRVLYRLPNVIEAIHDGRTIFVVEGEKDVHALEAKGVTATCNPMGAGKWHAEYTKLLTGADVVIVQDRDADGTGQRHAREVATSLMRVAKSVDIVEAVAGKDAYDHLRAGHTVEEFVPVEFTPLTFAERVAAADKNGSAPVAPEPVQEDPTRHLALTTMSSVQAVAVRWLWRDFIPLGKVTVLAGAPGLGKSLLTAKLAAQVSTGTTDGDLFREAADVLLVCAEDDPADTIKPRLLAAGANCDRVHTVDVRENGVPGVVSLPGDVELVEREVERTGARLVVLDPVVAFLDANLNAYREQHIRQALGPLKGLAERCAITVLAIMHVNKSETKNPLDKISNSAGFTQLARSVLIFGRDPEAPDNRFADGGRVAVGDVDEYSEVPDLRILANAKANSGRDGAAVRLRLEPTLVNGEAEPLKTVRLEEVGRTHITAEDLLGDPEDRGLLAECVEWLRELLADGPVPANDVRRAASEAGMAWRTVQRAKQPAGVGSYKIGSDARWMWMLRIDRERLTKAPDPGAGKDAKDAKDATDRPGTLDDPEGADAQERQPSDPGNPGDVGGLGGLEPPGDPPADDHGPTP